MRLATGFRDVHDLTHTFTAKTPVFPAFKPIQIKPKFSIAKDGFFANEITFDEHTGTHMDGPAHFVPGNLTADKLPADRFIAPLAVINIESRAAKNADAVVTVDDVLAWEKQHGRVPAGAATCADTVCTSFETSSGCRSSSLTSCTPYSG